MRTSKPVSTISYNSIEFLLSTLAELVRSHVISDYIFIKHSPEEDEKKSHIHLYLKLNRLLDTMDLQDKFREFDPNNPLKPLGCIDFVLCNSLDDWILYSQHYPNYLAYKGESRVYHYDKEDFYFLDPDNFDQNYYHAFKGSAFAKDSQILNLLQDPNFDPIDLISSGALPLRMAGSVLSYLRLQNDHRTFRGSHLNHDEDGVIIK